MAINDLLIESPIPCDLKMGDKVTYTNPDGVKFDDCIIVGFSDPAKNVFGNEDPDKIKRFIHIAKRSTLPSGEGSAYWFPHERKDFVKI